MGKLKIALSFSVLAFVLTSCGSSNSLQSISISQTATTAALEFGATGTFTDGRVISALPVSWVILGPGVDPPGTGYTLSGAPFFPICVMSGASYTVVAIAPADPNAPGSGSVPTSVWNDVVLGTVKSEGGFVGTSAQFTCA